MNHEVNTLSQVLRYAGLVAPRYELIPLSKWTPRRILSPRDEAIFFRVAASKPKWNVAYWVALLSANTTASGCEIRGLRVKHVDLQKRIIYIPSDTVKNEFRARVIPLNALGYKAVSQALNRYYQICLKQGLTPRPDHYLFPFRIKRGKYEPRKQAGPTFIRKSFCEIRAASKVPWLRPHDLRYQAITKLLELPTVSEHTVKALAGQVSEKMLNHYSHIRIEAKRTAVSALRMG